LKTPGVILTGAATTILVAGVAGVVAGVGLFVIVVTQCGVSITANLSMRIMHVTD
jgi:hypothetical protein